MLCTIAASQTSPQVPQVQESIVERLLGCKTTNALRKFTCSLQDLAAHDGMVSGSCSLGGAIATVDIAHVECSFERHHPGLHAYVNSNVQCHDAIVHQAVSRIALNMPKLTAKLRSH